MQYHNWDITVILTLDDASPFYNNFCSYMLGNMIFVTTSQYIIYYVLLFTVECTGVKDCSEKLNYIPAKTMDKQLWFFAHPILLTANYSPSQVQSLP